LVTEVVTLKSKDRRWLLKPGNQDQLHIAYIQAICPINFHLVFLPVFQSIFYG